MAEIYEDESPKTVTRRTLRAVNAVAGLWGLLFNTVTFILAAAGMFNGRSVTDLTGSAYVPLVFSVAWNRLEPYVQRRLPADHKWAGVLVDVGLFFGFLAAWIAGGIIQDGLWGLQRPMLIIMTYNSMPWVVCGAMHLFFVVQTCMDVVPFELSWGKPAVCQGCQRKLSTSLTRKKDGANYGLLNGHDEDEDVEETGV